MPYGGLMNRIKENEIPSKPEVGMGATLLMWSDRHAYTIHKVSENGKKLWASPDNAKLIAGTCQSENQTYEYSNDNQDDENMWHLFTLRKDGRWHRGTTLQGSVLAIGYRNTYSDPTF